jgi:hypothetical protein
MPVVLFGISNVVVPVALVLSQKLLGLFPIHLQHPRNLSSPKLSGAVAFDGGLLQQMPADLFWRCAILPCDFDGQLDRRRNGVRLLICTCYSHYPTSTG